jgi:hypothetical protein
MTSQHASNDRPLTGSDPDEAPVLPTQTGDDTDAGWSERPGDERDSDDERYLRERPPHWE